MKLILKSKLSVVALCISSIVCTSSLLAEEYLNGITWEKPPIIEPGKNVGDPPSDATILFSGTEVDEWHNGENWSIQDGALVSGKGMVTSKKKFGDCQLHIEWSAPTPAKGSGQGRGNSGLFLMGKYELQILDSYDNETYYDGQAGAIYKQTPPAVNATRPPGEWNTYDVFWTAPKFKEDGSLDAPAYITAIHNGVLLLNHFALKGDTPFNRPPEYNAHAPVGPISLQDHGNPVRFRNIWVREFKPASGTQTREPFLKDGEKETPIKK
jgi:hypothetical protein